MKRVKVLFSALILTLGLSFLISPQAHAQESITITTYYPAPHGIFSVLRLEPRDTAPADPGEGDIYYDNTIDALRYWNGSQWVTVGVPETLAGHSIIMWSGSVASIPDGWALCDGGTYYDSNGNPVTTPNLRDKFIVGAGGSYGVGDSGGVNSISLEETNLPDHTHTYTWIHTPETVRVTGDGLDLDTKLAVTLIKDKDRVVNDTYVDMEQTTSSGSGSGSSYGDSHENRPPYYALCFIMKL